MDPANQPGMIAGQLQADGYAILHEALPASVIEQLQKDLDDDFAATPFGTGMFYGERTKRFGRLLRRSAATQCLVLHPVIQDVVSQILGPWCDRIQLNTTQAISVHPGAPSQLPHRDQDMWQADFGKREYLVNVMWPLTSFTERNGGTRIWPQSHGCHALSAFADADFISPELSPGSALLFLGSTLHGAGENASAQERRGIVIGYSLGWLKPYENPWLAYPPEIAKTFPPALSALAGYVQHRPNLGNFEGQCPSVLLGDYKGEPLGAIDALRPDQMQQASAFAHGRSG
ncbi:MAG: phytanoyl-CoA dioxygenase [Novosphingobium sp. 28-62-57]|uniref:phytanoyl-CoA dioxygenase family protein n=1 Tax=Novosphingobium sp. 28-62-57 TaxID=1970409 RepID=UPI000BD1FA4D|nr:phytanoyl-CoA dioxygenase family protein [Novosphingobium sp. 28-62-57]OYW48224.1 MAG: phytanoyl-CoA dioxygenase [Novosphingobium sp. 12-62-10]OYZ10291.1 MAG: phytanoyl-CoA dioxygenase [Novosphingobium sp. 28-62-57]OZA32174.1 MAG: phytanoyl-CoA dioxygenase [Novosphingobium sp. 17-62-9]